MNIAIGKIGQALIFNRQSSAGTRSSTNGNVAAHSFFKLLIEKNPKDNFICIGDSDITVEFNPYPNLFDVSHSEVKIDIGVFMVGLLDDPKMIEYINNSSFPYILVCDDRRCLTSLNKNESLIRKPVKILSLYSATDIFKGSIYDIEYFPIEKTQCYTSTMIKYNQKNKKKFMTIIANKVENYDRLGIIKKLIKFLPKDVEVIGRLDDKKYPANFIGEVKYAEAIQKLQESQITLLVPVHPGCVTSKYVEALMNACLPIFYDTYDTSYICNYNDVRHVYTPNDMTLLYTSLQVKDIKKEVNKLQRKMIKPYLNGNKINTQFKKIIYNIIKEKSNEN